MAISIHVPSWGTTVDEQEKRIKELISIHVPSWGTTPDASFRRHLLFHFNPRSLVGNDPTVLLLALVISLFQSTFPRGERRLGKLHDFVWILISIHVPSWGTTKSSRGLRVIKDDFNPRSLVGNDQIS